MKGISEESFRIRVLTKALIDSNSTRKVIDQCTRISNDIIRRAKEKMIIIGS